MRPLKSPPLEIPSSAWSHDLTDDTIAVSTSGIVLTLSDDVKAREDLFAWLEADPRVEIGPLSGSRLPITVQHDRPELERTLWRAIDGQPAVTFMNLVFHHLDAPQAAQPTESSHDA